MSLTISKGLVEALMMEESLPLGRKTPLQQGNKSRILWRRKVYHCLSRRSRDTFMSENTERYHSRIPTTAVLFSSKLLKLQLHSPLCLPLSKAVPWTMVGVPTHFCETSCIKAESQNTSWLFYLGSVVMVHGGKMMKAVGLCKNFWT